MLIISDIHFGTKNEKQVELFLEKALDNEFNPSGLVVIPGDLTSHHFDLKGNEKQFFEAENFIKTLIDNNIKVILTPGNHDIGIIKGGIPQNHDAKKKFKEILKKYVFSQKNVEILDSKKFDSIIRIENDIFVSLRSVHGISKNILKLHDFQHYSRRIKKKQIEWATDALEKFSKKNDLDKFKLHFVTHLSIWKGKHRPMPKAERLEKFLKKFDFYSFIHGHNHEFIFAKRLTPNLGKEIIHISVPTISNRVKNHMLDSGYIKWENNDLPEFINIEKMEEMSGIKIESSEEILDEEDDDFDEEGHDDFDEDDD